MSLSTGIPADSTPAPITQVAAQLGLPDAYVEPYGRHKARIDPDILALPSVRPPARYILVSAITPTPLGEGKTTTAIGLGMALNRLGRKGVICIRQSSLGPVFGIKGGGAGGGRARVVPLDESILHVTGDIHAIGQAHNQIAAMTDNTWYHGNALNIDPDRIQIRRVLDVNDRFLREVQIGLGGQKNGIPRRSGFDITVASELMAILALVDGGSRREALHDLRRRIGRMIVAFDSRGRAITAEDVKAAGAATVLMRETIKPTLMQTLEQTPVFLHAGPFGNIAHGNSSILADRIALRYADFVVTEAGFGMDMGGEKFFDIKCRTSGIRPDAGVVVATIRALKSHTGRYRIVPGKPLPRELLEENPQDVLEGGANLRRQIQNLRRFGVPVIVALNTFPEDRPSEIDAVRRIAGEAGALDMALSTAFANGGAGALDLARCVIAAAEGARPADENVYLYPLEASIREKIRTVAKEMYGASDVSFSEDAEAQMQLFEGSGLAGLPICMAKTHLSLSHDSRLKGAPSGFLLPIRELRVSAGAGFITAFAGDIVTMPGLGSDPAGAHIDIDGEGNIVGLF